MSNKKKNKGGYKPVECQDITDDNPPFENTISYMANPYKVVGSCKRSKSGATLSMLITIDNKAHYCTILKKHIDALWDDESNLKIAHIREYDNENTDKD